MNDLSARRPGFTLLEVLVVTMIIAVGLGAVAPPVSRMIAQTRVDRVAATIATDLRLAGTIASQQRRPVRVSIDADARSYSITDRSGTVFASRSFTDISRDLAVTEMVTTAAEVIVFPNGLATGGVTITVFVPGFKRDITMTRAGRIRVSS